MEVMRKSLDGDLVFVFSRKSRSFGTEIATRSHDQVVKRRATCPAGSATFTTLSENTPRGMVHSGAFRRPRLYSEIPIDVLPRTGGSGHSEIVLGR